MALLSHPLLRLTAILETNPSIRVYFRASGGLARLAIATSSAAAAMSTDHRDTQTTTPPVSPPPSTMGVHASTGKSASAEAGHGMGRGVLAQRRFGLMLSAVAAALEGGERVAKLEVMKFGALGGCAQALRVASEHEGGNGDGISTAESIGAAGAAALVLCRVVDDVDVRAHIARCVGGRGLASARTPEPIAMLRMPGPCFDQ